MNRRGTPAVSTRRAGSVLVVTIDNPPVNALSRDVREGLMHALDDLAGDATLSGMVIAAAGRVFSAGADIREFDAPMQPPFLGDVVTRLDTSAKPVVASIQGKALGGGLELALACQGRVASKNARLGLPEVKLGLLPGSGGIVRLPRVGGLELALSMIGEGREIGAAEAEKGGIVDRIAAGDPVEDAVTLATEMAAAETATRRARDLPFPPFPEADQDAARKTLAKKFPGREAAQKAVDLLAMASRTPFDDAARLEHKACRELVGSSQSRALRYLFAAERVAAKVADGDDMPPTPSKAGVAGTGVMGRGIAMALLDAGLDVVLTGRSAASIETARRAIEKAYASSVERGRIDRTVADERLSRLTFSDQIDAFSQCDIVIETISEDLGAKCELIAAIDRTVGEEAIIATNTSFLDIETLARASTRPQNFAGLHFFNPANIMKLVEIVRAGRTAPQTVAALAALSAKLGKVSVTVGPSEGFVANRMLSKRTREALFLLQEGATPAQIDRVLTGFGFPVGPFTLADMAGLDVIAATRAARLSSMSERERGADIAERLVAAGRLGRKSGAGYYAYDENGKRRDAPEVADILDAHRRERGMNVRDIADEEVRERLLFALVNEGARLVDEGVAARMSDIDVVWTRGFGFPAHLGGPMFWASEIGTPELLQRLDHYASMVGADFFAPSPLIAEAASRQARLV
ncbi:MAG: 3-hydroxyacyl-CoA dehydrogenase NAD-binding domain-containing protein [Rhizobiaceae bacterium]|nr:3-hydroxyacyl-CoA dehydrogenase NAD-binding domain-containing protein [Rhizobiaceae bacterium]